MEEENNLFNDYVEEASENVTIEMPSEAENVEAPITSLDSDEKTLKKEICESEERQQKNEHNLQQNEQYDAVIKLINELKEQNIELLGEVTAIKQSMKRTDEIYKKYESNLMDYQDTFKLFEQNYPQIITQVRTDLKKEYKTVLCEAADNYKKLKAAISKDINKAIETWEKVHGNDQDKKRVEYILLLVAGLEVAAVMLLVLDKL